MTEVDFLLPREAAAVFRVDTRTLARWEARGRLVAIRTPGGHRRYPREAIEAILRADERIQKRHIEAQDAERAAEQMTIINTLISGAHTHRS